MNERKTAWKAALRYGTLAALYWGATASYGGFMVTFGLARGYAQSLVSIMCAGYMISVFAGQFFWGSVCDKKRTNKKVFMLCLILACLTQLGMFLLDSVWLFGILYALFGFLMGPLATIVDTWLLRSVRYDMVVYGVARGCGSAAYATVTLITGYMIEGFGYLVMPVLSTGFGVIAILLAAVSADARFEENEKQKKSGISTKDILSILKIPAYVILLLVVFFIGMANSPVNSLKIVVLEAVGGNVSTLGLDTFWGCMLQFLLFELAGVFAAVPAKVRLMIAAVAMVIAMGINFVATAPWMVITATLFMNVQYSFLMPAMRETILHTVDARYQSTANGLADAFYGSMSGALSLLYAGTIVQHFGARWMVFVSLILSVFPVLILAFYGKVNGKIMKKEQ